MATTRRKTTAPKPVTPAPEGYFVVGTMDGDSSISISSYENVYRQQAKAEEHAAAEASEMSDYDDPYVVLKVLSRHSSKKTVVTEVF